MLPAFLGRPSVSQPPLESALIDPQYSQQIIIHTKSIITILSFSFPLLSCLFFCWGYNKLDRLFCLPDINIIGMGHFCYWDAKSLEDTIILIILTIIETSIGITTAVRLRRISRLGQHGKKVIVIYLLILAWTTIIVSQQLYSIFVYFSSIQEGVDADQMDKFSQNYVRFDILPGFIVQTIFLTICRYYYKGLVDAIEISHLSRWQQKFINYLNLYFVFRFVSQAAGITLVNVYAESQEISVFSQVNIWILISDSVIMNAYLGLSLKIYLKRLNHIVSMEKDQLRKLKIEYSFMIISSLIRVVIDILFLTALPLIVKQHSSSACVGPFSSHMIQSVFYLIIGNVVNHIVPIIWVLKIYSFQSSQEEQSESQHHQKLLTSYLG